MEPQAILVPELPEGCEVKSSGLLWMMTVPKPAALTFSVFTSMKEVRVPEQPAIPMQRPVHITILLTARIRPIWEICHPGDFVSKESFYCFSCFRLFSHSEDKIQFS